MQKTEKTLTAKQQKAIAALLSQSTIQKAANEAGVSDRSIFNWLNQPAFSDAYRQARSRMVSQAIAGLQQSMVGALSALQDVMNDPGNPPSARVSAARTVLELAFRGAEIEDLTERIKALEKHVKQTNGRKRK